MRYFNAWCIQIKVVISKGIEKPFFMNKFCKVTCQTVIYIVSDLYAEKKRAMYIFLKHNFELHFMAKNSLFGLVPICSSFNLNAITEWI